MVQHHILKHHQINVIQGKSMSKQCYFDKYHFRKMSGLNMGSLSARTVNMTTPNELCDILGGSRVINKV